MLAAMLLRDSAQPLDEAPAVSLGIERLVGTVVRAMAVGRMCDLCPGGEHTPVVRVDVLGDVHADVLGRGSGRLRAERAVGALICLSCPFFPDQGVRFAA